MSLLGFMSTLILSFTLGIVCSAAYSILHKDYSLPDYGEEFLVLGCFVGGMIFLLSLFVSYLLGMSLLYFSGIVVSIMFVIFFITIHYEKSLLQWRQQRVTPQVQSLLYETQWYFNQKQYDKVISHAMQILSVPDFLILSAGGASYGLSAGEAPYKQTARKLLALTYVAQNRTDDEALLAYEKALEIEPNNVSILRAWADEGYRRCSQDYDAALSSP